MKNFNLSRWALDHKSLIVYFMLAIAVAGLLDYFKLGREEDPPFTIKTMVVKTLWPGATTLETVKQVTDRIEKKLEELPNLDYLKSYTKPGESVVFVYLKDSTRASEIPDLWYQARKKVGDIKQTLPEGVLGPSFNDEFGDTYSLIFALTSDGFGKRELRDYAERVRAELLGVPDVAKIDLLGTQDEKIYLEFSTQQLAAMGLDVSQLIQTLQQQNAIQPSGTLNTQVEKTAIRVSGQFTSEESLKAVNFQVNGRFFRLSDIAKVRRDYVDPQQPMFRYNGVPAIGLAISMRKNADVLTFGEHIKERLAEVAADLPVGVEPHLVADQPQVVEEAVGEFIKTLIEAIAIVLGVSFLSLGWRPGIVVAVAIPLVLAVTFVVMKTTGVSLQRIWCADHRARPSRRRRHDRRGDDGLQARGRRRQSHRCDLRLHLHGLPDAHRHPRHYRRLRSGRLRGEQCRRVLLYAVRRRRNRADCLLVRCRAVYAVDRSLHPSRQAQGPQPRTIPFRSRFPQIDRSRAAHQVCGHRGDGCAVCCCSSRLAIRAAAVLSQL
jgi:multidrug efflux pump subunit AcrB